MVFIRSRSVDERIDAARAQVEQQITNLMESVHTLHAGVDEELREGLREVRARIEALRGDGVRDLGQYRQELATCQDELRSLHGQVEALRTATASPPATSEPDTAHRLDHASSAEVEHHRIQEVGVHSEPAPDAVSMQTLFDTLTKAALISTAEIHCHRHTWAFIVRHVAHQPLTHELLPEPEPSEDSGLLTAHVSGPVLMGILNALHQTRHDHPEERLTREHIEEKALAGALFARITNSLSTMSGPGEEPASRALIVFDDRPAPRAAPVPPLDQPEPTEQDQPRPTQAPKTPPPALYHINGQILRAPYPLYCVARTKSGGRCRNPLEFGQTAEWVTLPSSSGIEMSVYDVGDNPRWMSQHCTTHDDPGQEDYCPPQWQPHNPETDG